MKKWFVEKVLRYKPEIVPQEKPEIGYSIKVENIENFKDKIFIARAIPENGDTIEINGQKYKVESRTFYLQKNEVGVNTILLD